MKAECWADIGAPLSIAALLTIAKRWKQPQDQLTDEQTNKIWSIHTGIIFSLKTEENPTIRSNMNGDIMLSEISQSQDDMYVFTYKMILYGDLKLSNL